MNRRFSGARARRSSIAAAVAVTAALTASAPAVVAADAGRPAVVIYTPYADAPRPCTPAERVDFRLASGVTCQARPVGWDSVYISPNRRVDRWS